MGDTLRLVSTFPMITHRDLLWGLILIPLDDLLPILCTRLMKTKACKKILTQPEAMVRTSMTSTCLDAPTAQAGGSAALPEVSPSSLGSCLGVPFHAGR